LSLRAFLLILILNLAAHYCPAAEQLTPSRPDWEVLDSCVATKDGKSRHVALVVHRLPPKSAEQLGQDLLPNRDVARHNVVLAVVSIPQDSQALPEVLWIGYDNVLDIVFPQAQWRGSSSPSKGGTMLVVLCKVTSKKAVFFSTVIDAGKSRGNYPTSFPYDRPKEWPEACQMECREFEIVFGGSISEIKALYTGDLNLVVAKGVKPERDRLWRVDRKGSNWEEVELLRVEK